MQTLYKKLFDATNSKYRCNGEMVALDKLSHFVSMKGCKYDGDAMRLFVVGRAVNGWPSLPCASAEAFASAANREFAGPGFTWIANSSTDDNGLHNIPSDGQPVYHLARSPFWRTTEKVWRGLSGSDDQRFVDYIAWSNLYKIAPSRTGNPTATMCKRQFAVCREILEAEIQNYKPTHILFITGYDYWYADKQCDFSTLFVNNKRFGSNNEDSGIFVEGTAEYLLDGVAIPAVITCRPEGRNESGLVSATLSAFGTEE